MTRPAHSAHPAPGAQPHTPQLTLMIVTIGLLLGLQPVTTDLYLPALPYLTQNLRADVGQAQLTLTALLLAFGFSQLGWGPLSDRFGRRPILLWGMGLYTVSAFFCASAPGIESLIVWRGFQGLALGAAVVCARAMIRDAFDSTQGPRVMAQALSVLGVLAVLSPLLGGVLVQGLSWRAPLYAVFASGCCLWLFLCRSFRETLAPQRRSPLAFLSTWRSCKAIAGNPVFLVHSAYLSIAYAGLFTFLASSSFIFIQVFGFSKTEYSFVLASASSVYIAGTFACRFLLQRLGVLRTLRWGGSLSFAGGALMALLAFMGWHQWWAVLLPYYLFSLSHGINQPCAQAGVVAPFPKAAGTAAALSGCLMMFCAFGVGYWVGVQLDGDAEALIYGILLWGTTLFVLAQTAMQRYGVMHTKSGPRQTSLV